MENYLYNMKYNRGPYTGKFDYTNLKVDYEKLPEVVPIKCAIKLLDITEEYLSFLLASSDLTATWMNDNTLNVGITKTSLINLLNDGLCICNTCGKLYPFRIDYFANGGKSKSGRQRLKCKCKKCYNEYKRSTYKENPFDDKKETIVYFISNGTHIKIGITSRKIDERIKEFKTGSSGTFEVIKIEKYSNRSEAMKREKNLHDKYKSKNISGEWFDILEEVNSIA